MCRAFRRYLQSAVKAVGREGELDPPSEFVGDEIAYDLHPIAASLGRPDSVSPVFLPFDDNFTFRSFLSSPSDASISTISLRLSEDT